MDPQQPLVSDSTRPTTSMRGLSLLGCLAILALIVVSCGSAAAPSVVPLATDTALPAAEAALPPGEAASPATDTAPPPTEAAPLPTEALVLPTETSPPATERALATELPVPEAEPFAAVVVADQPPVDGTVTVAEVLSQGPGWLAIHAQSGGKPGPVLGYSPVDEGLSEAVRIELDLAGATGTLYAMLHTDAGTIGTWEFPNGPDLPLAGADGIVMSPFALQVAEGEVEVAMRQIQFDPSVLVVKARSTVTWVNEDGAIEHNVESDTGLWHSEMYSGGQSFSYTFENPGVYPYHCHPHGSEGGVGMAGTVIVIP